jgi:NAD(P)-dependent dehydrogenase (short-subunit alcohol dehydrogenase family)
MTYWQGKRALILGGSTGLGRALAEVLVDRGARIAIVARGEDTLQKAVTDLSAPGDQVFALSADVTSAADVERLHIAIHERWHGVDFVAHCAGRSMRGDAITTSPEDFESLWQLNFLSAVRIAQTFAADLIHSRGHLVLVSSLAGKCAPRFLGAYPASKFPLTAFAQQLRLELGPRGMHTLLVSPGPIAREDNAPRYTDQSATLPESASRPGGGARLKAIDPVVLAKRILTASEARSPELVVPAKTKILFALAQLWPAFGDWILQKKTSGDS